uniref:Thioredoxin domain-containing protein n=1 Tax=viral metagenome TaxID=1070528 RepID=A0A6C0M0E4_9ZZZZ
MWWELAAILALALIVYRMYWSNSPKRPTKEGTAKLYFFHTEWCGFCKKAKPEWEKLKGDLDKPFGKTKVEAVSVNCEEDSKTCSLYSVQAYPTVKLETSTALYEYSGPITEDGLVGFLRRTLGEESSSV